MSNNTHTPKPKNYIYCYIGKNKSYAKGKGFGIISISLDFLPLEGHFKKKNQEAREYQMPLLSNIITATTEKPQVILRAKLS